MSLTLTTGAALLKECYSKDHVQNLIYDENPFLAMLAKKQDVGGKYFDYAVIYGAGAGRSAGMGQAQTDAAGSSILSVDFNVGLIRDYAYSRIDGLMLASSKGSDKAFLDAAKAEVDAKVQLMANVLSRDLFRTGWGTVGVVGSATDSTITLATASDVDNFEVGEGYVFAASESADALRDSGDILYCSAVDRDAGTVTFAETIASVSGLVAGDYVFSVGDRQDSASPTRLKVSGLGAWIPSSAPSSAAFHNVDRTPDVTRLAGHRYTPTEGTPIDQVLLRAASMVGRQGGKLDKFFMSFDRMNELQNVLGSKVQIVDQKVGKVGFGGVQILGPSGPIDCFADRSCPSNRIYGVKMDTWKLISAGDYIHVWDHDGANAMRVSGVDAIEITHHSYCNLVCTAPGRNIVVNL